MLRFRNSSFWTLRITFTFAFTLKFKIQNNINIYADIYLFKVNDRISKKLCEIYSKLTIKTSERR